MFPIVPAIILFIQIMTLLLLTSLLSAAIWWALQYSRLEKKLIQVTNNQIPPIPTLSLANLSSYVPSNMLTGMQLNDLATLTTHQQKHQQQQHQHNTTMASKQSSEQVQLVPHVSYQQLFRNHPVTSLPNYFQSLNIPRKVDLESVVASILESYHIPFAIPIASFLPSSEKKGSPAKKSQLSQSLENSSSLTAKKSPFGFLQVIRYSWAEIISPLSIASVFVAGYNSINSFSNLKTASPLDHDNNPLVLLSNGNPKSATKTTSTKGPSTSIDHSQHPAHLCLDLPNPFRFPHDFCNLQNAHFMQDHLNALMDIKKPKPLSEKFLPGLHIGDADFTKRLITIEQELAGQVLATILNKLIANQVPQKCWDFTTDLTTISANTCTSISTSTGEDIDNANPKTTANTSNAPNAPNLHKTFIVSFDDDSGSGNIQVQSPHDFIQQLLLRGYNISLKFVTRVTSFGLALSVHDQYDPIQPWKDVPIAFAIRTGLQNIHNQELVSLVPHAALVLTIKGPDTLLNNTGEKLQAGCEYFQGINGFTGWFMNPTQRRPWQTSPQVEAVHGGTQWLDHKLLLCAFNITTTLAIATNYLAVAKRLPWGGYGFTGMCLESVAIVQQALTDNTSIFPIILTGQAKTKLIEVLCVLSREFSRTSQNNPLSISAEEAIKAVSNIPSDVNIEPVNIVPTLHRIIATLPSNSPFIVAQKARSDAHILIKHFKSIQKKLKI